jgi:hypothetical protein
MKEIDHILSMTQFKKVFRDIQNKPTIHLREWFFSIIIIVDMVPSFEFPSSPAFYSEV